MSLSRPHTKYYNKIYSKKIGKQSKFYNLFQIKITSTYLYLRFKQKIIALFYSILFYGIIEKFIVFNDMEKVTGRF